MVEVRLGPPNEKTATSERWRWPSLLLWGFYPSGKALRSTWTTEPYPPPPTAERCI